MWIDQGAVVEGTTHIEVLIGSHSRGKWVWFDVYIVGVVGVIDTPKAL